MRGALSGNLKRWETLGLRLTLAGVAAVGLHGTVAVAWSQAPPAPTPAVATGNGRLGYGGDGGAATAAELSQPFGTATDRAGNFYIADTMNHRIRRVDAVTGTITTVAGTGTPGYGGDSGAAAAAELNQPVAVAVDAAGNLYIADSMNQRVRRVSAGSGIITTAAGSGEASFSGDGGAATAAALHGPRALALDDEGNLYIADFSNQRVRVVTPEGAISSVSDGNGNALEVQPLSLAADHAGNVYIADGASGGLRRWNAATGVVVNLAVTWGVPAAVASDGSGDLFALDAAGARVGRVNPATGAVAQIGAGLSGAEGLTSDAAGNLYVAQTAGNVIVRIEKAAYGATASLSPSPLSFPAQGIGTTSVGEIIVLSDVGTSLLAVSSINIVGDFTQTNNCLPSVGSGAGCTITVKFTPTLSGTRTGTLTVNDNDYYSASQSVSVSGTGALDPSVTTLNASVPQAAVGQTVTLTVAVASGVAGATVQPTGSVTYLDGQVTLGSVALNAAGTAIWSGSGLAQGMHSITATYSGDANFTSGASAAMALAVSSGLPAASGFGLTTPAPATTVAAGGMASYMLALAPTPAGSAFTNTVSFAVAGLPPGASATFTPSTLIPGTGANVIFTVQTPAAAAATPQAPFFPVAPLLPLGAGLLALGLALLLAGRRRLVIAALAVGSLALAGCSGGTTATGTPSGVVYNVTVTASGGTAQQTTALTLTVQ